MFLQRKFVERSEDKNVTFRPSNGCVTLSLREKSKFLVFGMQCFLVMSYLLVKFKSLQKPKKLFFGKIIRPKTKDSTN